MANKYGVYHGEFPCHTCGEIVPSIRLYVENKELTWMCSQKHMSNVSLQPKRKNRQDERKR
jgi:hypothetical protein